MQYFRTDKNGTKIFHDWTCQRCGGAGGADKWKFTGWTCHECGGSGKRPSPKIVRQYTPEHAAKLEAKARQRFEKKRAEENATFLARNGFADDGTGFVFTGDTYTIKDTLKAGRAKWNNWLGWIAPAPIGDFPCVPVNAKDICIFEDYYRLDYDMFINFKTRLMSIPSKLSPILAKKTDRAEIFKLMKTHIDEALCELSDFEKTFGEGAAADEASDG